MEFLINPHCYKGVGKEEMEGLGQGLGLNSHCYKGVGKEEMEGLGQLGLGLL